MVTLPYYCPHCHRQFKTTIPCCMVNKESTECPDCGRKASLEKELLFKKPLKKGENYGEARLFTTK